MKEESKDRRAWIATGAPVAIKECENYEMDTLTSTLRQICSEAKMPCVQGKTILVKPNILSDAKVSAAITTHPAVVKALVRLLKEAGAKQIFIGDSPGLQGPAFQPKACGIQEVCDQEQVTWCDFTKDPVVRTLPGTGGKKLAIASILDQVDMTFSVCKFKTHQLMYATGAVKNLFGVIPGLHKSPCHLSYPSREAFARMLCGIYQTVQPAFSIMDGIIGMEGAGPANGNPRHIGLLLASCDASALDVAQQTIMGYDPMTVPLTKALSDRKLTGWKDIEDIKYPLLDPKALKIEDFKTVEVQPTSNLFSSLILPFFTKFGKKRSQRKQPKPLFDLATCIRCGRCANICPAKALSLQNRELSIDYNRCIRCYCCHEVCPADAITIEPKESR